MYVKIVLFVFMCLYLEKKTQIHKKRKETIICCCWFVFFFFFRNNYFKLKAHLTKGIWMESGFSPN